MAKLSDRDAQKKHDENIGAVKRELIRHLGFRFDMLRDVSRPPKGEFFVDFAVDHPDEGAVNVKVLQITDYQTQGGRNYVAGSISFSRILRHYVSPTKLVIVGVPRDNRAMWVRDADKLPGDEAHLSLDSRQEFYDAWKTSYLHAPNGQKRPQPASSGELFEQKPSPEQNPDDALPEVMFVADVARYLDVSEGKVYGFAKRGELKPHDRPQPYKGKRSVTFPRAAVVAFAQRRPR